jgi:phage terminase large subunit
VTAHAIPGVAEPYRTAVEGGVVYRYFNASDLVQFTRKQRICWQRCHQHKFTLYGGARGGGKSYGLRFIALLLLLDWYEALGITNVRAGIFCETFPALRDRQLSKSYQYPDWLGSWNRSDMEFRLHPQYGSGVVCFRNLDAPEKYRSSEFAAILIDELTLNPVSVFTELLGSLRWPGIEHTPFIAASNPTGLGHSWVKDVFITGSFSMDETRNLVTPDPQTGEVMFTPADFAYVKALPTDNPHNAASYIQTLRALPDRMRKAFFEGSWDHFEGMAFEEWDADVHVIANRLPTKRWRWFAGLDWGFRRGAYVLVAVSSEGDFEVVWEYYFQKLHAYKAARLIAKLSIHFPTPEIIYGDEQMWQDTGVEGGKTISEEYQRGLERAYGRLEMAPKLWKSVHGKGSRKIKYDQMKRALTFERTPVTLVVEPWQRPKLRVQAKCAHTIRTLPALAVDPDKPEDDVDTHGEDHIYDALCNVVVARAPLPDKEVAPRDPDVHPGIDVETKERRDRAEQRGLARVQMRGGEIVRQHRPARGWGVQRTLVETGDD